MATGPASQTPLARISTRPFRTLTSRRFTAATDEPTTYRFTAEAAALIDRLVPPGHPSTLGYNEPAYPLEGRVTA